jgi:hypothetical protein
MAKAMSRLMRAMAASFTSSRTAKATDASGWQCPRAGNPRGDLVSLKGDMAYTVIKNDLPDTHSQVLDSFEFLRMKYCDLKYHDLRRLMPSALVMRAGELIATLR